MAISERELIDAAVASSLIDGESVPHLQAQARRRRESLLEVVTARGRFPTAALYGALAEARGLPFVNWQRTTPQRELVKKLPAALVRKRLVLPIGLKGGELGIATADPDDHQTLGAVERLLGSRFQIWLADPESLRAAIERVLTETHAAAPAAGRSRSAAAPDVVALLDRILNEAYLCRATDVHLEPESQGLRVRLRVDGKLQTYMCGLDHTAGLSLISRVKVLAGMNITEHRVPQDGRFSRQPSAADGVEFDIRVATAPTRWGERATLRLLGGEAEALSLERLGLSPQRVGQFRDVLRQPYGMVLVTGPTGSGKTTTLYAALREINRPDLNIMTVEDPVEYLIDGVSQIPAGGPGQVTFSAALRALLRHDPDVLMVGEIRDHETADMAIKAAMTGHLILTTLHTNSVCGAVTRLRDIGCESYLIGSTLTAVIGQRLVRRLCPHCKQARSLTPDEAALLVDPRWSSVDGSGSTASTSDDRLATSRMEVYEPGGCVHCLGTGYRGRIGLFEPLWIDKQLARLISRGATQEQLEDYTSESLISLRADGCVKVLAGITSLQEVLAVTTLER